MGLGRDFSMGFIQFNLEINGFCISNVFVFLGAIFIVLSGIFRDFFGKHLILTLEDDFFITFLRNGFSVVFEKIGFEDGDLELLFDLLVDRDLEFDLDSDKSYAFNFNFF